MGDISATGMDLPEYDPTIPVHAFRGQRGQRTVYTVRIPIQLMLDVMPTPDPNIPFPNNRPIVVPHAKEWGDYWEKNAQGWGCPAGLVSIRTDFLHEHFTPGSSGQGVTIGVLGLRRSLADEAEILDMQHRIFGWLLKRAELTDRLRKASDAMNDARRHGDDVGTSAAEHRVRQIRDTLERMKNETVTIEIMVLSEAEHRTLFAQIADKALKINASQIADFDATQVINRVAHGLAEENPLVAGRVDWTRTNVVDTAKKANPALISGETLVNLVRPFATGQVYGRVTEARNRELEAEQQDVYLKVNEFLNVLAAAFPELGGVMAGTVQPTEVRSSSLLGSRTMLRVLAGAYQRLTTTRAGRKTVKPMMARDQVLAFFKDLAPLMALPLDRESIWFKTGFFPPLPDDDAADLPRAPMSRQQDLKGLVDVLVRWAIQGIPSETNESEESDESVA